MNDKMVSDGINFKYAKMAKWLKSYLSTIVSDGSSFGAFGCGCRN
jgi:hypothetical protein